MENTTSARRPSSENKLKGKQTSSENIHDEDPRSSTPVPGRINTSTFDFDSAAWTNQGFKVGSKHDAATAVTGILPPLIEEFVKIRYQDYRGCHAHCEQHPATWSQDIGTIPTISAVYLNEADTSMLWRLMERYCMIRYAKDNNLTAAKANDFLELLIKNQAIAYEFQRNLDAKMEDFVDSAAKVNYEGNSAAPTRTGSSAASGMQDSRNEDNATDNMTLGSRREPIDEETDGVGPNPDFFTDSEQRDLLDRSYATQPDYFFFLGRVFEMVWHENAGAQASANTTQVSQNLDRPFHRTTQTPEGVLIFSHMRRFVVVKPKEGFCWAIPINSYTDQGLSVKRMSYTEKQAHAIVYSKGSKARYIKGEPKLLKDPIAVTMAEGEPQLTVASRLHFAKVQTINYNVKVKNIGIVEDISSLRRLSVYFQRECRR